MKEQMTTPEVETTETVVLDTTSSEASNTAPGDQAKNKDSKQRPKSSTKDKPKEEAPIEGRLITIHVKDGKATLIDIQDGEEMLNLSFPDVPHRLRSILELNDAEIKRLKS